MVLTEEEKKEYLINYKQQIKWHSDIAIFLFTFFIAWFFISILSYLGYINLDLSDKFTILFLCIVGFFCGKIIRHVKRKARK